MFGLVFAKKPHNYQVVDDVLSRSAMPTSERNMKWLKKHGVTTIVNLRQSGSMVNGGRERAAAEKYGIKYFHIPINPRHPHDEQADHFLDIVEGVKQDGGHVHVHCTHGKDRTGALSWIYKQKNGLGEMYENEREMRQIGHEGAELPMLVNWVKDYLYKDWGGRKSL